jgi:hypothetical protein
MTTQVMTRKELILLLALERMIELTATDKWHKYEDYGDALLDAREAVRIARLET